MCYENLERISRVGVGKKQCEELGSLCFFGMQKAKHISLLCISLISLMSWGNITAKNNLPSLLPPDIFFSLTNSAAKSVQGENQ